MATSVAPSALSTTGGTSASTLSDWVGPYVTDMLGKAKAISGQDYQVYGGPVTADATQLQKNVFQGLGGIAFPSTLGQSFSSTGAYQLPSATGGDATGTGTGTGIAAQYMNPYLNAVLTPQLQEMRRQAAITQNANNASAIPQGAFGGSRNAIMNAENQRNLSSNINNAIATGYSNAYDRGLAQFNTEQGQQKTLADMMYGAGANERAINQEGLTADYNEFLAQRDYPMKQVQFEQSMLQGLPTSTVTNTAAQQSTAGNVASAIGGLGSLFTGLSNLGINWSTPNTSDSANPFQANNI